MRSVILDYPPIGMCVSGQLTNGLAHMTLSAQQMKSTPHTLHWHHSRALVGYLSLPVGWKSLFDSAELLHRPAARAALLVALHPLPLPHGVQ